MSDPSSNDQALPTVVLVHGAWGDATGFDAVIRALREPRVQHRWLRQSAAQPGK